MDYCLQNKFSLIFKLPKESILPVRSTFTVLVPNFYSIGKDTEDPVGKPKGHTADIWKVLDSKPDLLAPKPRIVPFHHSVRKLSVVSVVAESVDFGIKINYVKPCMCYLLISGESQFLHQHNGETSEQPFRVVLKT